MEFKFNKGDRVCITYGSAFGSVAAYINAMAVGSVITDRRVGVDENEYKLKGYIGWWHESNLVAAT